MNFTKQSSSVYLSASNILLFCILLLPLHTQVFYMVLPFYTHISRDIVSIWKEVLFVFLILIFILNFFLRNDPVKLLPIDLIILSFILFLFLEIPISDNRSEALYGLRVFSEPLVVFYLARHARLSIKTINKFFIAMFYSGVIISVWGIIQASILGDKFLINLGYDSLNGKLMTSFYIAMFYFQRAVGTFGSPNTFGIYLQICVMLGIYLNHQRLITYKKVYYLSNILMLCALIYSFSRSAILALILSMTLFNSLIHGLKKCMVSIFVIVLVLSIAFTFIFFSNKDIVEPLITHTKNTLTLQDPSVMGHIDSINNSINFTLKNPFGIGLGKTGPRASARTGVFINSENSFFILLFDLGIYGLFLYLLLLCLIIVNIYTKILNITFCSIKSLYVVILSILIGQLIAWNLLPYIVELETTLLLFFIVGLAYNNYLGTKEYA